MTRWVGPASLVLILSGCPDALVGAECQTGFVERGNRCVAESDGGIDAGDGSIDAMDGQIDAPFDGDASGDASLDSRDSAMDGSDADAGMPLCDLGEVLCSGTCVRPSIDPLHCGRCDNACAAAQFCQNGMCVNACLPPAVTCDGRCFDPTVSSDPDNCGTCGNRCASGICVSGTCIDAAAGHLIVIGHDYEMSRVGMNRLAGNSVFLGRGNPVSVVVFEGTAAVTSIAGVDRAIDQVANERGRSWTRVSTTAADLLFDLDSASVLVVYPQPSSSNLALNALGTSLATGLASFLRRGGVIVSFDTPGANAGTYQIVQAAGLFSATSRTALAAMTEIDVVALGDSVALGVPVRYRAETNSVRFDSMDTTVVARDPMGPVVIHRVFPP